MTGASARSAPFPPAPPGFGPPAIVCSRSCPRTSWRTARRAPTARARPSASIRSTSPSATCPTSRPPTSQRRWGPTAQPPSRACARHRAWSTTPCARSSVGSSPAPSSDSWPASGAPGTERAAALREFVRREEYWAPDLALYVALRESHGGYGWTAWPLAERDRAPEVVSRSRVPDNVRGPRRIWAGRSPTPVPPVDRPRAVGSRAGADTRAGRGADG